MSEEDQIHEENPEIEEIEDQEEPEIEGDEPEDQAPEVKEDDPDRYVKSINKKHRQYMEQVRANEELQQKIAELQQKLPKSARPEIPPPPDPFDSDYAEKIKARDEALLRASKYDAQQELVQRQQQQAQEAQMRQAQEAIVKTVTSYTERAEKLGLTREQLQQAGNAVAAHGFRDDLSSYILEDEEGPLLTAYLARHPEEIDRLNNMHPVRAGVMLETIIKPKAKQASGRTTAPPPPDSLGGGGAPPKQRGPAGATFE